MYKRQTLEGILRLPKYKKVEKAMDEKAMEILKVFDLDGEADVLATNLPYGKQRKLEIARAMAVSYTHQDVYKRQDRRCRIILSGFRRILFPGYDGTAVWWIPEGTSEDCPERY